MKVKYFSIFHLFSFVFIQICTLFYFWQNIPTSLHFHSDFNGVEGNAMSKLFLFLFPLINGLLIIFLDYISKKPDQWNLPSKSADNLTIIPKILLFLSYVVSLIFTYFVFSTLASNAVIILNSLWIVFLSSYFLFPYLFYTLLSNDKSKIKHD